MPFGRDQYEVARRVEVARCGTRHRAGLGFDPGHRRCGCDSTAKQSLLESWGYSVITAGSYDETLRKVVTRPERPGADHLRLSRARACSLPGIPRPTGSRNAQASGYLLLHKPVANEVLHAAIARLMQMQPPAVAGAPGT